MRANTFRVCAAILMTAVACAAPGGGDDETAAPETEAPSTIGPESTTVPSTDQTEGASSQIAEAAGDPNVQPRIFGVGTSCSPNPCQNGGTCVDQWLGYTCQCPAGFTGARCETRTVSCLTYTAAANGKCGGLYCGLTQAQLASKLSFFAACNQPAAFTCAAALPRVSGYCARNVKAANPLDNDEQLRPKINACIAQRPELVGTTVSSTCTNCYTSYQLCVSRTCLIECLVGDSPECDACQRRSGCLPTLYACSGLPNPL